MSGFAIVLVAVVAICLAGCAKEEAGREGAQAPEGSAVPTEAWKDQSIVVTVNGTSVTKGDVAREQYRLTQRFMGQATPEQLESMSDALRARAVDNLINRIVLEQAVEREGTKIPAEQVESRVNDIKGEFDSEEAFIKRLADLAMTEDEFREEIKTGFNIEALMAKQTADIEMPDQSELKSYYDSNVEQFKQPEQVSTSHILISVSPDATDAEKTERRAETGRILEEIRGGADFAEMASKYSDCPSRERGGDLGFSPRGRMVPEFESVAFSLEPGELSDVVETMYGYHIIKAHEHTDAREITFEEAKDDIAAMLHAQRKQAAMMSYTDGIRAAAVIEYADSGKSVE